MYLPQDIINLILLYKTQLNYISVMIELEETVDYYYCSQCFSQLSFNDNVISYYRAKDRILFKIHNTSKNINGIYYDSIISILK